MIIIVVVVVSINALESAGAFRNVLSKISRTLYGAAPPSKVSQTLYDRPLLDSWTY